MALDVDGLCPLLQVFDMPTSVKFYREVLGFELVGNSPIVHSPQGDYFHWAMLRRGSNTLMLNTAYDEGERPPAPDPRSEEHTSELQSQSNLVCRLLLEKK